MVKTFLSVDLSQTSEIDEIYTKLAHSIHKEMPSIPVIYKKCDFNLNSVESVKAFLISKDFYEYSFLGRNDFWYDLSQLHWRCKIENILSPVATCDSIQNLHSKYPLFEYSEKYRRLEPFPELNVSELKSKTDIFPEFKLSENIKKAFEYTKLNTSDRHTILVAMNVPVCPYCNMNYTIDLINHGQQKSTADIDHFYLKSEYPEYALCLYNFVPSCSVCNGRLKGSHSMNRESYIFPHEDSFENKSNFAVKNIIEYILGDENGLTLMLEHSTGDIAVENSAKLFKIEERYQQLVDYAKDLVDKYLDYSSLYMDELENDFESLFSTGNIRQLVFGSIKSEKEFSRDSLGKLNRDLLLQLGIFDDEK